MNTTLFRLLRATVLVGLLTPTASIAQSGSRSLTLEDYYSIKSVGSPSISPDGMYVAYTLTSLVEDQNDRHSEVWVVAADGSGEPRRLTSPGADASSPNWSPDGSLLAFSSNRRGGTGLTNVWFLPMDGPAGEAFQIPGLEGAPTFSPDGRWIAFVTASPPSPAPEPTYGSDFERKTVDRFDGRIYDWMNYRFDRRGYLPDPRDPRATPPRELFVMPSEGGTPRRLTSLGVDAQNPAWDREGRTLAFAADTQQRDEYTYERSDLWIVTVEGDVSRLSDDEFDYGNPVWSPDGSKIIVRGNESLDVIIRERRGRGAASDLFAFASDGSARINLTANWDYMPGSPTVSPDGRYVYFSASVTGTAHLFRVPIDGGRVEQITSGERMLSGFSFTEDFRRMAFEVVDPQLPGDIFVSDINASTERRLTDVNHDLLVELSLGAPERIAYNSPDGTPIEGWVLAPSDYAAEGERYPMVLTIHGGPHGAYGNSFSFEHQLLAARGYVVLYTNPRASTGYGEDFRWGTWGGWGMKDYEDIMAGVDYAVERFAIDTTRMGVTGYSYGGYMTNWVITQTNRFSAAVAGASISNWVSDYGTADIPRTKESEFYGPPWEEESRELLLRSSPIVYAGNVTTPTMFVHGEADHRVPIAEAEQMYVALKKQRVPAKFVRYPESYHGGWTPWRFVHRMYIQLEWWNQYLGERPTSE